MSCGKKIADHILEHEIIGFTTGGGGGTSLSVKDEGVLIGTDISCLNFVGADIQSELGVSGTCVNIYVPPPTFVSHWNTDDGTNGSQLVTESLTRSTQRISTPNGGEGTPFKTNGWAGTNQDASLNTTVTFTTPGDTTGWGGDSTLLINVYDANSTLLETYTTPSITGNIVLNSTSTNITVTITNYGIDATKFKANASVEVDIAAIFANESQDGGRYHIEITHTTDTTTDGGQTFLYTQDDVFLDTNTTTPSITGSVGISEGTTVLTKHLSGIEYYILNSGFDAEVNTINQLNKNTSRTSSNLVVEGADYGLATQSHSPFGTGSTNFTGWTNNDNVDNVNWALDAWVISQSNYRFIGTTGSISAYARDGWASSSTVSGSNSSILVDTYGVNSTNTYEPFDDESRRQEADYTTAWDSTASLTANEALVQNSRLMVPNQSTYVGESTSSNADWSAFKPDLNGANPDYSALAVGAGVSFYRTFPDTASIYRPNMTLTFSGTFAGGNALTDLVNEDLQIFVRKIDGIGFSGKTSPPLYVHGSPYNAGFFDDGSTNGQIRLGSSSSNTIECTFGTFSMLDGIYMEIKILNNAIKINSLTVTFN